MLAKFVYLNMLEDGKSSREIRTSWHSCFLKNDIQ